MHHWLTQARRHAAEIHNLMQLTAGAIALAAVLAFVTLSGRSQDDPVVRWMAEVGATMSACEIIMPADSTNSLDPAESWRATANAGLAASLQKPAAPIGAAASGPDASRNPRHTDTQAGAPAVNPN